MNRVLIILAAIVLMTGCATHHAPRTYHISYMCSGTNNWSVGDIVLNVAGPIKTRGDVMQLKRHIAGIETARNFPGQTLKDVSILGLTDFGPAK